jgi:hypothetical protein
MSADTKAEANLKTILKHSQARRRDCLEGPLGLNLAKPEISAK